MKLKRVSIHKNGRSDLGKFPDGYETSEEYQVFDDANKPMTMPDGTTPVIINVMGTNYRDGVAVKKSDIETELKLKAVAAVESASKMKVDYGKPAKSALDGTDISFNAEDVKSIVPGMMPEPE